MANKLIMSCTVLVAFTALVPAVVEASPVLTDNLISLPVGSKITGTQVGTSKITTTDGSRNQLECSTGSLTGELTKNNGTEIEANITSALFGGTGEQASGEPKPECTGESGLGKTSLTAVVSSSAPWCLKLLGFNEFKVSGGNCGGTVKNLRFIMATTIAGNCEFESTGSVFGTYTTDGTSAVFALVNKAHTESTGNGFKRIAGSVFCPSSSSLDLSFTLETDTTEVKPLVIS
ncbi:MAG: hypothetical protein ACTHKT_06400 [Solirubrobacterales bacterium]